MKTKHHIIIAAGVCALVLTAPSGFSQGSLTPPGAPAPTMLTLNQIEPRTPINTLSGDSQDLYVISQPGSYYLTTNITVTSYFNAISINTNDVTLDLNGFTISSTGSGSAAILLVGNEATGIGNADITISNGHITGGVTNNGGAYSGPGFNGGISYNVTGGLPLNVRVSGVSVSGCLTYGIYLGHGNSTIVESCTVRTVGNTGIRAGSVSHSAAYHCGSLGIDAQTASDCYGDTPGGLSVYGLSANTANNCIGNSEGSGTGLYAFTANTCNGGSVSGTGLSATIANNCYGICTTTGTGLSAVNANNCSGTSGSGTGLNVTGSAIGCSGSSPSGVGISATIANSCTVGGGTTNITYKYNMP